MKRYLTVVLSSAALLAAVPGTALAQYGDWGGGDYGGFRREFDHLEAGIDHGLRDGSYTRRDARHFYNLISDARGRLDYYWRDGRLSRWERRDMRIRLGQLHNVMHVAHEEGHDAQDYGYYDERYGPYGG
jgi:hypothetical protein